MYHNARKAILANTYYCLFWRLGIISTDAGLKSVTYDMRFKGHHTVKISEFSPDMDGLGGRCQAAYMAERRHSRRKHPRQSKD